ncbi:MAG: DUF1642 domain-containing protein [Streptococcaceae bacterium]|jgi:hypothetical protein|nr:DUF1642 domain-containing protein [Streptococcaceae bacterium]
MSELSKEELIEALKVNERNCSDSWDRGYNVATENAIVLAKQLPDTPSKPVVPKYVADWFEKNKNDLEFNIWSYIDDWNRQDGDSDFFKFMDGGENHSIETLIKMKLCSYEVEQPKRWVVKLNNDEGYIFDITRSWTYKKVFETKNEADAWAELHDGTVEEV